MKVFTKYLLKSITEKKGRTLLLLLSIAVSAALLVASLGSIKALLGTLTAQVKGNYGDYNVVMSPKANSAVPLFKPIAKDKNIKKSFKSISVGGYLSNDSKREIDLVGTTLTDFKKFSTMKIIKKKNLEPFTGSKIIISQKTSKRLKLKLGDKLKLNTLGKEKSYTISAISTDKGLFFGESGKYFSVITPEENVFSVYGQKNKYSTILAVVKAKNLNSWIKTFNNKNKALGVTASKLYDEQAIEQQLSMIKYPLFFMLGIVLIMTTFIIYSSFKLIITERLSVIGVFLSQGATKGGIVKILLRESLAYGILGGILGDLIGAGLTKLVSYYGNPLKDYGIKAVTEYYIPYFVIGFIFAVVLSLLSTIIPILSIRKLPVKDVILNTVSTANKVSLKSFVVGIVFIIISVILHLVGSKINYVSSLPGLFFGFIGIIMIIPKVVDIVFYPFVRILRNVNGLSMLSFNNVRTSKVLLNNMRLIAVSIISIVIISSLSSSMVDTVAGAYKEMNFDVYVNVNSNYLKNINDIIHNDKDISRTDEMGTISANLNGDETKAIYLDYINPIKYRTFENYSSFNNKNKELDALNKNDKGIILSKQLSLRYNIKKGDTITVNTDDKKVKLKVLSIFNAKMFYGGNYNLISFKSGYKYFDAKYASQYYLSTKVSGKEAKKTLEKKLKGLGAYISTKAEMNKNDAKSNKQLTDVLGIFSYITMVIGAFGIIGNVSISFLQRKREIAVVSSVGLTKSGRGYLVLLESVFQALLGVIVSLLSASLILVYLTDILKFLTMDFALKYPYSSISTIAIAAILLMIITSLPSIFKSRRLEIVKELKYE